MHPATILAAIVGLVSAASIPASRESPAGTLEKRACFHSGEHFGFQKAEANRLAAQACADVLASNYSVGESQTACYNMSDNKSVKFTLRLSGPNAHGDRKISIDECTNGLQSEIVNCDQGGQTTYGHWYYRADPNTGPC